MENKSYNNSSPLSNGKNNLEAAGISDSCSNISNNLNIISNDVNISRRRSVFIIMNSNNLNTKYNPTTTMSKAQDLAYSFQYFLIFGKIIGVLPISGIFSGRVENLKFKWRSISVFLVCTIIVSQLIATTIGIIGFFRSKKQNTNELAWSAHLAVFYATGLVIYIYFLLHSQQFISLLQKWKQVHTHCDTSDPCLRKCAHIIAGCIMTSIILENISWHFKHSFAAITAEEPKNKSSTTTGSPISLSKGSLEAFYENSEPEWSKVFAYHPANAIFLIITNKWAIYSWNFCDILIIIISRALYHKFKILSQKAEEYLTDPSYLKETSKWKEFLTDHLVLTDLLSSCKRFFSPMVFLSYCVNIYNVCIHLSLGLSPAWNTSTIGTVYAIWAFAHLTIRIYMVSIYAAKINEHAMSICKALKECPIELYDKETAKFERQLFPNEVGLSGLGYFTITKSFMLRMLGVIFTVEIVLLQNPITDNPDKNEA